jgi:hypothetical protein
MRSHLPYLLGLGLFSACESLGSDSPQLDPGAIPAAERYGGTAVIGIPNDPATLNPLVSLDLIYHAVAGRRTPAGRGTRPRAGGSRRSSEHAGDPPFQAGSPVRPGPPAA